MGRTVSVVLRYINLFSTTTRSHSVLAAVSVFLQANLLLQICTFARSMNISD